MVFFFFSFLFLFIWAIVDFKLGRHFHLKHVKQQNFPLRKSNISLFTTGQKLFDDLFEQIEQASKHVHILLYIVKDDNISHDFLLLLVSKAKQGVEVRLLLDQIGSNKLSKKMIQLLKKSGVKFSFSHVPRFPFYFYSLNARNHRKITVIDGEIGYIGGFNIGKEYLGQDPKTGAWRDYHLKIQGEGVQDLQTQFAHDWNEATKEDICRNTFYFPPLQKGDILHKFIPTNGAFLRDT